ncbi:hypothetical protein ACFL2B_00170 [Patescibacteria group bacterium]
MFRESGGAMPPQSEPGASKDSHEQIIKKGEKIWLVTPEQLDQLPDGTELTSIVGKKFVKGKDEVESIESDYSPYGFPEDAKPEGLELNDEATFEVRRRVKPERAKIEKEKVWLITPEQLEKLPDGVRLTGVDGSKKIKGEDEINQDTKFGYLGFGLAEEDKPENIELNDDVVADVKVDPDIPKKE